MRVYRYKLPLRHPIRLGALMYSYREGLLLNQAGQWAEAAPLPGFSSESIEDVIAAMRDDRLPPPSLQFALNSLSRPLESCKLRLNALLQGTSIEILKKSQALSQSACRAVKLKVGRQSVSEDVDMVCRIRKTLRDDQTLRLDANRAWDWNAAIEFASGIGDIDIEYIEEPLQDCTRLDAFARETRLPYALDETLAETVSIDAFELASVCVIKPTLLGDRTRIEAVAQHGKPLVFSACYESGVGLSRIAQLANEWSPQVSAGLDTYHMLNRDVLSTRFEFSDWQIRVPKRLIVDTQSLEEVKL